MAPRLKREEAEELFRRWKRSRSRDVQARLLYAVAGFLEARLRTTAGRFSNARTVGDLVADTQVKLLDRLDPDSVPDLTSLVKKVQRMLKNGMIDRIRKNRLIQFENLDEALALAAAPGRRDDPALEAERAHLVRLAVDGLPPRYADVVRKRYFQELSPAMIARSTGRTEAHVHVLLTRARRALERSLGTSLQD